MKARTMNNATRTTVAALAVLAMALPAAAGSRIEREYSLAPGGEFVLDTDVGSVEVTGTSRDGVRLIITSRAEDLLDKFELEVEESGGRLEISFEKEGSRLGNWMSRGRSGNVRFEIEVPRDTEVEIDTAGGSIHAERLDREVLLDTSGGSITAIQIDGDVNADTSGGSIRIEDVNGDVNADTSGGSISVENVRGDVQADTSGGSISIEDVDGDVNADTSGGSIEVLNAGGEVRGDTSGGTVRVSFRAGNGAGGTLSTSGGGIYVDLDPSVGVDLDAVASGGSVELNVDVSVRGKISKTQVMGRIAGGGNTLRLRASGGKIRINPL